MPRLLLLLALLFAPAHAANLSSAEAQALKAVRLALLETLPPYAGRYAPSGPDRDCKDFSGWLEAQGFYHAAGGPRQDPHRLDADRDGLACEMLR